MAGAVVFAAGARGDAAPIAEINGLRTHMMPGGGALALDVTQ